MPNDPFQNAPRRPDVAAVFAGTALVALLLAPWYGVVYRYEPGLWPLLIVFICWNGLSITTGYHRLWSHRAYEAHFLVRLIFALGGALALQNSIKAWCSDHRNHHRYVDDPEKDPYSAKRGLWYSHLGWMLKDYPSASTSYDNIEDLCRDPIVEWQHRHYWTLALTLNVVVPLTIGAMLGDPIGGLLLLGFVRLFVCHHTTFFINSLAHYWGRQPYSDANTSRDNGVIALLTFGEGYHNFHHAFHWDYRNGIRWYHFDPSKWLIRCLSWTGLARSLKKVPPEKIEKSVVRMQLKHAKKQFVKPGLDTEELIQKLEREYEQLIEVLNQWARYRRQWVELRKQKMLKKWERTEWRKQIREIERKLDIQRQRWYAITQQFAQAH